LYFEFLTGLMMLTLGGVLLTETMNCCDRAVPPLSVTVNVTVNFFGPVVVLNWCEGVADVLVLEPLPGSPKFHA
jgi:hypothetical protein